MNNYTTLKDDELTALLNEQDLRAYEEIYNRYWRIMFEFARKRMQDNDLAKDIVQDSFISLYSQIGKTDFRKISIASYLYKTVQNTAINHMVRDQRKNTYLASLRDFVNAGQYITDEQVREKEILRQIDEEVARLPRKMRAIFEMSRKGYMSRREIAEATNVSEETVKKQIANALKLIRNKLGMLFFFYLMAAILYLYK